MTWGALKWALAHIGIGSSSAPPLEAPPPDPLLPLPTEEEKEEEPLSSAGGDEGAPCMAWAMAFPSVSSQSCISKEPSAWSSNTRTGEVTLNEKFLSVSFTSAG